MAYCAFHKGDYKKSLSLYEKIYQQHTDLDNIAVNIACCYFYLGKQHNFSLVKPQLGTINFQECTTSPKKYCRKLQQMD